MPFISITKVKVPKKWIQRTPFQDFRNFSFNLPSKIGPIESVNIFMTCSHSSSTSSHVNVHTEILSKLRHVSASSPSPRPLTGGCFLSYWLQDFAGTPPPTQQWQKIVCRDGRNASYAHPPNIRVFFFGEIVVKYLYTKGKQRIKDYASGGKIAMFAKIYPRMVYTHEKNKTRKKVSKVWTHERPTDICLAHIYLACNIIHLCVKFWIFIQPNLHLF